MLIILNGPPGSGKDYACDFLVKNYGFSHKSFKASLFVDVIRYFGLSEYEIVDFFHRYFNRLYKEKPVNYLRGYSPRDAMIYVSEDIMKKRLGKDFYGKRVVNDLTTDSANNFCFSDGGFVEELQPLFDKYPRNEIAIVQIYRKGFDFSKDSRSYILGDVVARYGDTSASPDDEKILKINGIQTYQIYNNGSLSDFDDFISKVIQDMRSKNIEKNEHS